MKYFLLFFLTLQVSKAEMVKPSTEFLTFWGGLNRYMKPYWHEGKMTLLKSDSVLSESLPVYMTKKEGKAPLVILFPGVFGKPDGMIVPGMIHEIEKLKTHVIVFPSLISESYLGIRKNKSSTDIWSEEAQNQISLVKAAIELIGEDKIESISLIAESLGSWQAIMLLEGDFKFSSFVLLAPPLHLNHAVDRFDDLLVKNSKIFNECSYWWKWPFIIGKFYQEKMPNLVEAQDNECLGAYGIHSFEKSIAKVSKKIFEKKELKKDEPKTFRGFVEAVMPEFLPVFDPNNEKLSILAWREKILQRSTSFKIVSAEDDFLNSKEEWAQFLKEKSPQQEVIIYPYGGHSGLIGEDDFWQKLLKDFKL
jgi:hypothetical protein